MIVKTRINFIITRYLMIKRHLHADKPQSFFFIHSFWLW